MRFYFSRLAIEQVWLVLPLGNGFDRRRDKKRVPVFYVEVFDNAINADVRQQYDGTFYMRFPCGWRVSRLGVMLE